jgi:hypothetical protein
MTVYENKDNKVLFTHFYFFDIDIFSITNNKRLDGRWR